jgi:hypothetical protein
VGREAGRRREPVVRRGKAGPGGGGPRLEAGRPQEREARRATAGAQGGGGRRELEAVAALASDAASAAGWRIGGRSWSRALGGRRGGEGGDVGSRELGADKEREGREEKIRRKEKEGRIEKKIDKGSRSFEPSSNRKAAPPKKPEPEPFLKEPLPAK